MSIELKEVNLYEIPYTKGILERLIEDAAVKEPLLLFNGYSAYGDLVVKSVGQSLKILKPTKLDISDSWLMAYIAYGSVNDYLYLDGSYSTESEHFVVDGLISIVEQIYSAHSNVDEYQRQHFSDKELICYHVQDEEKTLLDFVVAPAQKIYGGLIFPNESNQLLISELYRYAQSNSF